MAVPELRINGNLIDDPACAIVDSLQVEIACSPVAGARAAHLTVGGEHLGAPTLRLGDATWRWQWHPRGRSGAFDVRLVIQSAGERDATYTWTLPVVPAKLEQTEYEELLNALQRVAAGLILELDGGRIPALLAPPSGTPMSMLEDYWTRITAQTEQAAATTRDLLRGTYDAWRHEETEQNLEEITTMRADSFARMAERPLAEVETVRGGTALDFLPHANKNKVRLPRSLPVRSMQRTSQRYEHEIFVRLLLDLQARCNVVREAIAQELTWRERTRDEGTTERAMIALLREWQRQANVAARTLMRCRTAGIFAEIEPTRHWHGTTELMRRDRRYRGIARLRQMLTERPFVAVESPAFDLPVGDLPSLYERWCLFEVARALGALGPLVAQDVFEQAPNKASTGSFPFWRIRLGEDRPLVQRRRRDGATITLAYHRRFLPSMGYGAHLGSLDPFLRIPDIVVEVTRPGEAPRLLIFDAKYRVAPSGGIPEDALEAAYAYRSAIGYSGIPASLGVFLLFPGTDGFEAGGVGAIPLRPGQTDVLDELVSRYLGAGD